MKFNLLDYGYITVSGTPSLNLEDIQNILSRNGTVTLSGSENHNLSIYGDIVDRIGIDQIRYYFDSNTSSGTVASGIHFYYKNDDPVQASGIPTDPYLSLTTNIGNGYYYATVPGLSAPRYIKLNHTVSGTSISGTVVGFEVLNDDSVVDFGADGSITSDTTLTSLSYLNYNDYIKEIEVYNSGSYTANAHVFIDPQLNDTDELLSISDSENGPWVFARNEDYIIVDGNNWGGGRYDNTNTSGISDGKLRLSSGQLLGTYTTPIFKNDSVRFAYIDMSATSVSGSIVSVDSDDYVSTIEIRSSNTKPLDYNVYRKVHIYKPGIGKVYLYYKDYLISNDNSVYNSYDSTGTYWGDSGTGYYGYTHPYAYCYINPVNSKCVYITAYTNYYVHLYLLDEKGYLLEDKVLSTTYTTIEVKFIEMGPDDDIWFYFSTSSNAAGVIPSQGYYLIHYDADLNQLYKEYSSADFIISCDIIEDGTGSLWCSRSDGTNAIYKLSSTGEILISYDNITDVGRLCTAADNGCWFIDDNVLYKLDSNGSLESTMTGLVVNDELTWVMRDESDSDFLWIIDGAYIKLITTDGRVHRSVYFTGFNIDRLVSTKEYLCIYCTEVTSGSFYLKLLSRASGGIVKTIENSGGTHVMESTLKSVDYDNVILGDTIPLDSDPVWNDNLAWNKAVTNNAVLPREEYNQLRLTLRRPNSGIDSPTVNNIYYQDNVELIDIQPGQSKTLYLKISIPDGMTVQGDYASNLRVWWELPTV